MTMLALDQDQQGNVMEMRSFGRTGMRFSILGFGCGAVGGLMVRGDPADQERTVARALDAGVNYFDTAVQYGDGASETNLGRVLKTLKPANAFAGTKACPHRRGWGAGRGPRAGGGGGPPCGPPRAPPAPTPPAGADRLGQELRRGSR